MTGPPSPDSTVAAPAPPARLPERSPRQRLGRLLAPLFPAAPGGGQGSRSASAASAVLQAAAVALGAVVLLARQDGHPAWDTVWAEDRTVFLPRALMDPWGSFLHYYGGYVQLVPQFIADVVARFPLRDAAVGFAVAGALAASACALFVYHASAGHVRQPALRLLIAVSVLLLPVALVEVADSGVNAQWYLMYALFWALLARPASRGGQAAAALIAFLAMASNVLNLLYLPLVAARALALPRARQHAVTAGWLAGIGYQVAGIMVQLPPIFRPHSSHQLAGPRALAAFYGQHVLVASLAGWRLAPRLIAAAGLGGAVAAAAGVLGAAGVLAFVCGGSRVRLFLVTALLTGLLLTVFPAAVRFWVTKPPSHWLGRIWLPGSRFTVCAILLIDAAGAAAVDDWLRRARGLRAGPTLAAVLLVAGLGAGWLTSFSYPTMRSTGVTWEHTMTRFDRLCAHRPPAARVDLFPRDRPQSRTPIPCARAG